MTSGSCILHASCVAVGGRGVLVTGPSGSGKSALALQLIAMGAWLVADDRTVLTVANGVIYASAPDSIAGMIEARGMGILTLTYQEHIPVALVVDMGQPETERLPPARNTRVLDFDLPCLHKVDAPYFPAAINAYMLGKRDEAL